MKISMITLGCKVNQYESESMLSQFVNAGFSPAEAEDSADVVVVNSCTVTASSDHKVRQALSRARRCNPGAVLVLTGCMPQAFPERCEKLTDADIILGNRSRALLLPYVLQFLKKRERIVDIAPHQTGDAFEPMTVKAFHERTRAFVKIEDGCNRFCSYCIIPYARGRVRSKPIETLQEEISSLAANGYREIVLTGINLSAYGQDLGLHLCDAVDAACEEESILRVRLGSLEPEQLEPDVIRRLSRQPKLCPQFHLSLQSGCDATLRRMNRHYTTAEYRTIVQNLRSAFENTAITTDIMVGFPGETEAEFASSLAFASEIAFARAHIFPYSRRPGTAACNAPDQLQKQVKESRARQMAETTTKSRLAFHRVQCGRTETVLFEQAAAPGIFQGYTANYTPVRVRTDKNLHGQVLPVRILSADTEGCTGILL